MAFRADPGLSRTFAALADPTRRQILARLEKESTATISALAEPLAIKLPAVLKHLEVLSDAGLISRVKRGRTVEIGLIAKPIAEAASWLERYERFWTPRLDRLAGYAKRKEVEKQGRSK